MPQSPSPTDKASGQPFVDLTPDCLLNALDSVGLHSDGRLLALNSYENRVYQVGMEDASPVVVKVYRPARWNDAALLEEHGFLAELAQNELPVVPPLVLQNGSTLLHFKGFRLAVFPRQGGWVPELNDSGSLERMGRLMARIHAVGAVRPYQARPTLDIASFGEAARDYLLDSPLLPAEMAESYRSIAQMALERIRGLFELAGEVTAIRLHGDCYPGNVLWTDDGPHLVDFDDSRMGPAIQDLWMLLSGDRAERGRQLADLLGGYEDFFDFDTREIQLIEALRTLRMMNYAAWLAWRWDDPAFPQAFPWFGKPHYWQQHILELREQVAAMDEPPLWSS
jgi:Ser/Thr protein kinase RdoA (MazF antagonist)